MDLTIKELKRVNKAVELQVRDAHIVAYFAIKSLFLGDHGRELLDQEVPQDFAVAARLGLEPAELQKQATGGGLENFTAPYMVTSLNLSWIIIVISIVL